MYRLHEPGELIVLLLLMKLMLSWLILIRLAWFKP